MMNAHSDTSHCTVNALVDSDPPNTQKRNKCARRRGGIFAAMRRNHRNDKKRTRRLVDPPNTASQVRSNEA